MATKPLSLLVAASLLQVALAAYSFEALNNATTTPGGQRFEREIGIPYVLQTMPQIADFIFKTFRQSSDDDRKHYPDHNDVINLYVQDLQDGALGETGDNGVYMSAKGIEGFVAGSAQFQFTSILYHEMTHIFQWNGQGTAPGGLMEGVADYIVLKSPFVVGGYSEPGQGEKWDEGYGTTSRFLEYCDGLRDGFTAELNKMMREAYNEGYFRDLLGKDVEEVWTEYKSKYSQEPSSLLHGDYS